MGIGGMGINIRLEGQDMPIHLMEAFMGFQSKTMFRGFLRHFVYSAIFFGLITGAVSAQVPNAPGTGPFTVQMFIGSTQYVYLALNPPTMYTDGTPIPVGTAVSIRIYRSSTGAPGSFTAAVQIDSGGTGTVGQGAAGTQQKPWIDIRAITPVNCVEPCFVFLAATAVVNGVESPQTTNNLTFRYAVATSQGCYPTLIRYATPQQALAAIGGGGGATTPPGTLAPDPPGTGPYTVQMFMGGTQNTYLCLNPPRFYVDGSRIPDGTPVTIKIYRSFDQGQTYTTPVTIAYGGTGTVGQGAAGTQQKPWIDLTVLTPVDCVEPCIVYLAATAVIGGIESALTTDNLTFRYAVATGGTTSLSSTNTCYPVLVRFATPWGAATGQGLQIPTRTINVANPLNPSGNVSVSIALVIDMSGSMNSTPPGGNMTKVAMAKQAAIEALRRVPAGGEVCLISFGRASCDVNVESRFTTDFTSLEGMINALNGNGMTPLAAAIYKARDVIVREGQGASGRMVLLSDGQETCNGDALKAAQDVRDKNFGQATQTTSLLDQLFSFSTPLYAQAANPQDPQNQGQNPQPWTFQDPNQLPPDQSTPALYNQSLSAGPAMPTPGQPQDRSQLGITINPIGLGVDPNSTHMQTLNQIAQITGGQSFSAGDLNQLTQAFTNAVTQAPVAPVGGGGGGGGGIPPTPSEDWTLILLIVLLLGGAILVGVLLATRRRQSAPSSAISARLDIVYRDGRTKSYAIVEKLTTIGRSTQNLLVLNDPEASGVHAELLVTENGFLLRDLGSANGTFVNKRKITQEKLYQGDEIRIGTTRLILGG